MADSQSNDTNTCVVCFKNVLYYSIGECDHPVCFECSTRMRVLCQQNECPICRHTLSRVVFTDTVQPYKELRNRVFTDRLFERQFKIGFCNEEIKDAYYLLLENQCKLCDAPPFRTFNLLSDHTRKVHERYFCDLCVKHLKIFTSERKCYTRQELAHHRRKGDIDDTSHRGHPLCEFCEQRFMDADELYRHLRKEHLYCHLCDADGKNLYYASHTALAQHFRTEHYLCEEGECAGQHLVSVFRTEIDLKAHKASVHGRGQSRGASRMARTLELQFNITPHPAQQRQPSSHHFRERAPEQVSPPPTPTALAAPPPPPGSVEHFPRLSSAAPVVTLTASPMSNKVGGRGLVRDDKNFPALDGSGPSPKPAPQPTRSQQQAASVLRNSKPSVSIQLHSTPTSASNFRLTQPTGNRISIPQQQRKPQPLSDDDFPTLGMKDEHPSLGAGTVQPSKVGTITSQEMQALKSAPTNHQPKRQQLNSEAFPALTPSTSASAAPPQWIKSKPNNKTKQKPEPPPQPKPPSFNPTKDFPTLPQNKTKPKKSHQFQPPPQPKPQPAPTLKITSQPETKSKKEKKKNNAKKENVPVSDDDIINGDIPRSCDIGSSVNNNSTAADRKIKTIEHSMMDSEKNRNLGNGDFKLAPKEYPPLSMGNDNWGNETKQKKIDYKKVANGVPPGFKLKPACEGMTFTNSSGQNFPAPVHSYIPPPDFEHRNRALVNKFASALGGAEALEDFKAASRSFRDNLINAEEFYEHCKRALGSQWEKIFPELVALLPDIAKQQELMVGRDLGSELDVCPTCGQVLVPDDRIGHDTAHWPPLHG